MFHAGVAQVDITPAAGLPMDGYMARVGVSLGAHDPLFAQVLVLADNDKRAAIVTLDVLGLSAAFTDPLRQLLAQILDTTPDAVMVCASHTHCGPAGLQARFGAPASLNPQLMSMISERVTEAAQTALNNLTPAHLVYTMGDVEGIGGERNHNERAVHSQVTAFRFDSLDGVPIAILFHYACHPTILGADTLLYSADFPGVARTHIHQTYPSAIAMYLNGAAGNVSTRFTRRGQSFEEVQRLGHLLGSRVVNLLENPSSATANLAWQSRTVEFPFRTFADTRSLPSAGNTRIDQTRAEGAIIEQRLKETFAGRTVQPATLHLLHIGLWKLAFIPGEPYNDLAGTPLALVVGYANDYLGYFPTQSAIDDQTYEALSSPYDARAHNLLAAALSTMQ